MSDTASSLAQKLKPKCELLYDEDGNIQNEAMLNFSLDHIDRENQEVMNAVLPLLNESLRIKHERWHKHLAVTLDREFGDDLLQQMNQALGDKPDVERGDNDFMLESMVAQANDLSRRVREQTFEQVNHWTGNIRNRLREISHDVLNERDVQKQTKEYWRAMGDELVSRLQEMHEKNE